jgi:catechol 2,3-dioxygenase-like lactoylglutathione lyase family enzyme
MLKYIAIVTILVNQLAAVETPYREELGYEPVHRGAISTEQATLWDAPAMAGSPFVILQPASQRPVYLRIIESPGATAPDPGRTWGWNAAELLTSDPDALESRLGPRKDGSAFRVVGPSRDLWKAPDAPRAMQAMGPANELLYFTRVIPSGFQLPMSPATTPVDRVFIMVVGGPSMEALTRFYGGTLGLRVSKPAPFPITTLSRSLGLPLETTYPLATAALPRDFLVELDEYPSLSGPRTVAEGSLPPGVAMVSFGVTDLDDLDLDWRSPPARIAEFPYSGQEAAAAVGPAGEWLEFIEVAGLAPDVAPGIPLQ